MNKLDKVDLEITISKFKLLEEVNADKAEELPRSNLAFNLN